MKSREVKLLIGIITAMLIAMMFFHASKADPLSATDTGAPLSAIGLLQDHLNKTVDTMSSHFMKSIKK